MKFIIASSLVFVAVSFAQAEVPPANSKIIRIDGATGIKDFVQTTVSPYANANKVGVSVSARGAQIALACVLDKTCQMGALSFKPVDTSNLVVTPLGFKANGIIVSADVTVKNITTNQIKGVFTGKIVNWRELGGPDLPITVWHRKKAVAIRTAFEEFFNFTPEASDREIGGHAELMKRLQYEKGVKGMISYAAVFGLGDPGSPLRVLNIDGVEPTTENVVSGKYKFVGPFYLAIHKDNAESKEIVDLTKLILAARKEHFPQMGIVYSESK